MIVIKSRKARVFLRFFIPLIILPALVAAGELLFDSSRHIIISLSVAALTLVLFYTSFEEKNIGSRRLVIASILTALSVIGRFIPLFKPVTALTIIAALYLGPETGFLVGSLSALISNIYFGQGPWTAFQMLAWGLIGFLAGYISKPLLRSKALLLTYGALSGLMFSLIMDIWTVLWYSGGFNIKLYTAAVISAIPHTIMYALSNVIFLFFLHKPIGEKLGRIKVKYGL